MSTEKRAGRPLKYVDPGAMQDDIDAYFAQCCADDKPPTVSGLAYHLEMTTESLRNYEARDAFFMIVKRAKQRVEMSLEERLYAGSPVGAIFNLKNNFGWKDKSEQELSGPNGGPVETVTRVELVAAVQNDD